MLPRNGTGDTKSAHDERRREKRFKNAAKAGGVMVEYLVRWDPVFPGRHSTLPPYGAARTGERHESLQKYEAWECRMRTISKPTNMVSPEVVAVNLLPPFLTRMRC
jgi:hypothetical protein